MRVKLQCSWYDYYDSWFDGDGYLWQRHFEPSLDRPAMMKQLLDWGFQVPSHGIARTIVPKAIATYQTDNLHFVVHTDTRVHNGEGKILVTASDCAEQFSSDFVVQFLGNVKSKVFTAYRFVRVGGKCYGVKLCGNYWKADYSDNVAARICTESVVDSYNDKIPYAVYSIDYVVLNTKVYAIDFNNAPQLSNTVVGQKLSGKQAASQIKNAIEYYQSKELNYCGASRKAGS